MFEHFEWNDITLFTRVVIPCIFVGYGYMCFFIGRAVGKAETKDENKNK